MMKKVIIANAFSLSMLTQSETLIKVSELSEEQVRQLLTNDFESAIGHESTARFLSKKLSVEIKANRKQIKLDDDTVLVVVQLMQRLPEGKVLSEEEIVKIPVKFYSVEVRKERLKECMREFHTAIEFIDDCIRICREGEKVKEGEKQDYVRIAREYAEQAFLQLCEVEKECEVSIPSAKKHIDDAINELNTTKDLTIAKEFMMIAREKLWDLR